MKWTVIAKYLNGPWENVGGEYDTQAEAEKDAAEYRIAYGSDFQVDVRQVDEDD